MSPSTEKLLERVASWPEEDIAELEETMRLIEARRAGHHRASADELKAIEEAERSGIASDEEVEAAFRTFRSA
jgi:hypothetical protein